MTEFVPKGTLHSLRLDSALSSRVRLDIAAQVCAAMKHLAAAGVIHGNLASRNVMVGCLSLSRPHSGNVIRLYLSQFGVAAIAEVLQSASIRCLSFLLAFFGS